MKLILILFSLVALKTCDNSSETNENQPIDIEGIYNISTLLESDVTEYKLTIQFNNETKQVSGFSGCNRFFGGFTTNENSLTFDPLASTKMMCQGEANTIEAKLLDQLSKVKSYSIKDSILILKADDDKLITAILK